MAVTPVSKLKPLYLIYGPEELLIERQIRRMRERIAEVADLDFNYQAFEGPQHEVSEIVAAANTLPFMSDRRLVIVRDVDQMSTEAKEALITYAEDPAEHTCLVLVARRVAKNTRLYKAVERVGGVHEFAQLKRSEYPREVTRMFEDHGKKVDRDAAQALVDAVGRDLRTLSSEVDKLVAHAGAKKRLVKDDILEVVSETSPTSVFDFTDAIGSRDAEDALRLLARLVADGERVHGMHAMAVRHVRDLVATRSLLDRRESMSEMMSTLGKPDWIVRKLVGQAERFREEELTAALCDAAEWEAKMKTSRVEPRLAVERWAISVCEGA
jgi:DNA polymerase-3 subunit delta